MASAVQAGLSDAVAGAGAGSFLGPYGAAIGAGAGGLLGLLFGGSSTPTAPTFSDINLEQDNPTLWAQLQNQQNVVNQIQQLYTQRAQGMTPQEQQQYNQQMGQTGQALAHSGMAGTSQGLAQSNQASQNYLNNIAQRIMQQQQTLGSELTGAQQGLTNATAQGLQQTYNAQMVPYQQAIGQAGNQNQMYNGLFQGGASLLGQYLGHNTQPPNGGVLPQGYGMGPQGLTAPQNYNSAMNVNPQMYGYNPATV